MRCVWLVIGGFAFTLVVGLEVALLGERLSSADIILGVVLGAHLTGHLLDELQERG